MKVTKNTLDRSPNPVRGWLRVIGVEREGSRDALKLNLEYRHLNALRSQVCYKKTDLGGRVGEVWDC